MEGMTGCKLTHHDLTRPSPREGSTPLTPSKGEWLVFQIMGEYELLETELQARPLKGCYYKTSFPLGRLG